MRQLDFLIVGAPKCGTTAIHSYLSRHPQVFLPTHKEPHFFGSDLDFQDQQRPNREEYSALFAGASPDQRIGEGSVFYLASHLAAREIREHSPNARIIVILRNHDTARELVQRIQEAAGRQTGAVPAERDQRKELRTLGVGAQILSDLGVRRMRVMSAPINLHGLHGFDLEVVEFVDHG